MKCPKHPEQDLDPPKRMSEKTRFCPICVRNSRFSPHGLPFPNRKEFLELTTRLAIESIKQAKENFVTKIKEQLEEIQKSDKDKEVK